VEPGAGAQSGARSGASSALSSGLGPGAGAGALALAAGRAIAGLRAAFAGWIAQEERERRVFLWAPVFFGSGALLYFAADREPPLAPALLTALALGLGGLRARALGRIATARACAAGGLLFAGFACAVWSAMTAAAPVLERPVAARVTAFVESVDLRPGGARLHVRLIEAQGLAPDSRPLRARVNLRGAPDFEAGAVIRAAMRLAPPPRASEPGGYDFAREAYFQRIGAVGSVLGRVERAPDAQVSAQVPVSARLIAWVDRGRNALTLRIIAAIGGTSGAVAAALVTGKRGLIPEETNEALRAAGVYHVVSISGLHMALAAGLFLWGARAFLALFPALALRRPIKKWAACAAMAGAVAYDLFSGAEVATERAMTMTLVLLGAVLFDRPALSMRNLALAALIALARDPASLLGPSFQMSFAAVAAMIAVFEKGPSDGRFLREAPPGLMERGARVLLGMMGATLVAGLSTDPFATFHFHRLAVYGLIGNALALPLVEFVVMPAAALGAVASAFGLDAPVWRLMGLGVEGMLQVAGFVASLPGAVRMVPAFGAGALLLMAFGLLWLTLWRSRLRWFGLVFAFCGAGLALAGARPDLLVDSTGRVAAFRGEGGRLVAMNGSANPFGLAQWLASDADARRPAEAAQATSATGAPAFRCDAQGCVGRLADGRSLALVLRAQALPEDCARADVLVTPLRAVEICAGARKAPALVLDGAYFAARGATHVFFTPDGGFRLVSAREPGLDRPWTRAPAPVRAPPGARGGDASTDEQDGDGGAGLAPEDE
jgi:competence protein ComEC